MPNCATRSALLAGVVRRDGEWVLGMDGRIAGHSESAAQVLALIMQAGELHERNGTPVRLMYSMHFVMPHRPKQGGARPSRFKAELAAAMAAKKNS